MICPKCNALNDDNNAFCVNCGEVFRSASSIPQTVLPSSSYETPKPTQVLPGSQDQSDDYQSTPTVFGGSRPNPNQSQANFNQSQGSSSAQQPNFNAQQANFNPQPVFNPSIQYTPPLAPRKSRLGLVIGIGVFLILLLGGGIVGVILLLKKTTTSSEVLPDHIGIFFQNNEKTSVEELKKQDVTNGLDTKDKLLKDDSIAAVESKPNLILYSDDKDIPLNDLKLIQLDSIKNDGTMKLLDYKSTPVDGKPEMKRLSVQDGLAKGKYAFAIIDGNFDDGKHKFWVFQVKNSDRADNNSVLKDLTVSLKNKSNNKNSNTNKTTPTPKPTVAPPVGSRTAYASTDSVVVRDGPNLNAQKISSLKRGQKVYVIGSSDNYDKWNGLEGTWANIQTESGQRGWVFSPLLKY